jgi:hypothetical protein
MFFIDFNKKSRPFYGCLHRLMEIYDQFTEWEHLLELSLHDKDGYKKIIDSCTMVTPETVCLMDKEFNMLRTLILHQIRD